jgi:hypothetical protein
MKRIKRIGLIAFSTVLLAACGGESSSQTEETTEETVNVEGMTMTNLRDHGFEGSIFVPNEEFGAPEFERTNWGSLQIRVGGRYGMELQQEPMSVEEKKAELMDEQVYTVEFIEESPNLLFWKKSIPDSGIDPEFQFFYLYQADGFNVEIKSFASEQFSESAVNKMIQSAKSYDHTK